MVGNGWQIVFGHQMLIGLAPFLRWCVQSEWAVGVDDVATPVIQQALGRQQTTLVVV